MFQFACQFVASAVWIALLLAGSLAPAFAQTFSGLMSGSWWDASRAGEGQFITFESTGGRNVAYLAYFTYTADSAASWQVGNIDYAPGATSISIPLVTGAGPRFGTAYSPAALTTTNAGTANLEFVSCTQMRLRHSAIAGVTLNLTRLVGPLVGTDCTASAPPTTTATSFSSAMSGQWWNAARGGEGQFIAFESVGGRNVANFAYFTYTADGQASWLVGNADYSAGATSVTIPLITGAGPRFGTAFRTADLTITPAGSARLDFVSCSALRLTYAGTQTFTVDLTRLVGPLTGYACSDAPPASAGKVYYISPSGSDSNSGAVALAPFKTFAKAFGSMAAGDELVLLDGTYSEAAGTGYISFLGAKSAQPPSGLSLVSPTIVRAQNPGSVRVIGGFFLGRSNRKDSYIKLQGITFVGSSELYNCDYCTVKDVGVNGGMGIGTNDHNMYSDHNLIEDVWIWASGERVIAINYRSHFNTWRRVIVRGDGCGTTECSGSGNPNVGITVYDSNNVSLQNVVVVDRILAATDSPYADFAVAQHTPDPQYYFGKNEWLGTLSIKAPDSGYVMEPDAGNTIDPTIKISNAVAWDSKEGGFNVARAGTNNLLENLTIRTTGSLDNGIRVAPELTTGTVRNAIVTGSGRFAVNSKYVPSYMDVSFTASSSVYNQTTCSVGCLTTNPTADTPGPSLKYITRIEAGSRLKGAGSGGADIGANIVNRYGADGMRHGEPGYNTLTAVPLWPWPNESRIKSDMCAGTTRGFCSTGTRLDGVNDVTLTSYIWEYLGNPIPPGIYPP